MSLVISAYFTWCQHQYQLVLLHELDNKPKVPRPVKMDAIQVSLSFISTLSNYVHQHCTQILNTNMRGMQIANPAYSDASCRESLQRVHFHLIGALKHSILTFLHLYARYILTRDLIFFILHILVPTFMRVRYLEMFDLWTHFLHHPSYVFPGGVGQCGFHGVGSRPDVCIHGVDTCGVNFN